MDRNVLAIVIKASDYKENDKMVTLFSGEFGRIDALAKGAKKGTGRLSALVKPFVCGEFAVKTSNGKSYITQGEAKESFFNISTDIKAYSVCAVLLEACQKLIMPEYENKRLFALLANSLYAINQNTDRADEVFAFFVIKLLSVLGETPDMRHCCVCGSDKVMEFDFEKAGAVCDNCKSAYSANFNGLISQILSMKSKDILQKNIEINRNLIILCVKMLENILECKLKGTEILLTALKIGQ